MQDGSCSWGCDTPLKDDLARQFRVMSMQMGGMHMGREEFCWKTPESSVSPNQHFERDEDEGTDFGWLCMEG